MHSNFIIAQFVEQKTFAESVLSSREFLIYFYMPIMIWLVLVLILFILLFRKYPYGKWTPSNPNPSAGETFEMPRGVFRGTLTLTLLFVVVILELVNIRMPGFEVEIREFMTAFQMMVAFYFGSKVMHHVTSADRDKTKVMAQEQTKQQEVLSTTTTTTQTVMEQGMGEQIENDEEAAG